jgi:ribosomal protein S18 acetylase RimI-like enzyme
MNIEIRTARADDRGPIAELLYSSGPHVYDYIHGPSALGFLRYEFASGRGFAGHPNVTVAVLEGEVVATGCFYDRDGYPKRVAGVVQNLFGHHGMVGGSQALARTRQVGGVVRRPEPGELYLSNFGVAQALRGQGIGSRLLAHELERARQRGYRVFGLDVSTANPRGEALYRRLGLVVTKEKKVADPRANVPPARKMEMVL